jgi:hypothetical protein
MKIWCIFKGDIAIKWRELLVVEEPSPLACVTHNIFAKSPYLAGEKGAKSWAGKEPRQCSSY